MCAVGHMAAEYLPYRKERRGANLLFALHMHGARHRVVQGALVRRQQLTRQPE